MASLRRLQKAAVFLRPFLAQRPISTSRVVLAYWNKDWKPGPYPKTPEERAAAAKKYGLRVDDYEPYPDDGFGHGDYPKLSMVSQDARSENEDWDIPEMKRNFMEPLHVHEDAMAGDKWNPNASETNRYSYVQMFGFLSAWLGTVIIIYYLTWDYPLFQSAMPKQYPYNNLHIAKGNDPATETEIKHFTFEPAD